MFDQANEGEEPENDLLAFAVPTYPNNQQSTTELPDVPGRDSLRALELGRLNLTPMESSRNEVEYAAARASRRSKVYIGQQATKAQFKAAGLADFKIIHLALSSTLNPPAIVIEIPIALTVGLSLTTLVRSRGYL